MTGRLGPSAFVAAIFAVHPLHVESVAWAIERKDVLSGALFAATLVAWARYASQPGVLRYAGVLLLFGLGLAAKPMLVTLPCVLLLLDGWPLGRLGSKAAFGRAALEKIPLLALSVAASLLTVRSQTDARAFEAVTSPLVTRVANALASYGGYLRKVFAPVDLAVFYPHRGDEFDVWAASAGAAVIVVVSLLAATQFRRRPWFGVGWLWYLGMLVPVIGLLQVGAQAMADRYMYLPLVGVVIPVAWLGAELAGRSAAWRGGIALVAIASVLVSAGVARRQVGTWRDDRSLYEQALAVTERNANAHNGLAVALLADDRDAEARQHLEAALEIDPRLTDAHVNLGVVELREGNPEAAIAKLRAGLSYEPARRATIHAQLGLAQLAADRPEEAMLQARLGLVLRPNLGLLHAVAGISHVRQGEDGPGLESLQRAEALGVESAGVQSAMGDVLMRQGRPAAAAGRYRRALERAPNDLAPANNLAWLLATEPSLRDPAEAVRLAEHAAEIAPADAAVLDTLAVAYHAAGRRTDALAAAGRAAAAAHASGDESLARTIEERSAGW
ncbi:MAG: tetratricopeptide repeat protein [Deltaproteobacteria bacterium]|nr:tetratricopeptide repeat protein [Deltaproteobacteria bacterium]